MFKKFTCWLLAALMVLSLCVIPAAAETTTLPGTGSAAGKTVTLSVTPRTPKVPYSTEDTYVTFDITITPPERRKIAALSFALAEPTGGMTLAAPEGSWWKVNSAALAKHYAQVNFSPSYTRYFGAGGSINGGIAEATRVMSVTAKIPANTAPGEYYLRVVTAGDEIDIFTAGLKNGDQYSREVIYTPVTVVSDNGIYGRIQGAGDESVTYALYQEGNSEPVLQGSAIDEFYWFGISDGTYRLEISGSNIVTHSFDITVSGQSISASEDIRVAQYGDVNGTGEVDISDVACLYECLTTETNSGTLPEDYFEKVADLNGDDTVDVYDLQFLYEVVSGISSIGKQPSGNKNSVKVGFITLHDENSVSDLNFIYGIKEAIAILGLTEDDYILKNNVPEDGRCYETAIDMVNAGCNIIFASSFGHEPYMIQAAQENPNVQFCHSTGTRAHTEGLSNYHNAFASIYEGRYLAGIAAGMKLNEMIENGTKINGIKVTPNNAKIGYVAAFTYAEVISGYTAFFLGARSVCPTVTMDVTFTGSWYDEALEKEGAQRLIDRGCKLISQHADSLGAPTACENAGVPNVSYNGSTKEAAPNTYLVASRINWAPYYQYAIQCVIDGKAIDTDWTGTLATGSVVLTELNETVAAASTADAIAEATAKLKLGEIQVFDCSTFTVNGEALTIYMADVDTDEDYTPDTQVIWDGYFAESEFRSAPYFDLQIDGIHLLNTAY